MAATPAAVAKAYFAAVTARDIDAMVACWKPGGREHIRGQFDGTAPDGVREFFSNLFHALPDWTFEVQSITANKNRACVRWSATGTFVQGELNGIAATGARVAIEGIDELTIEDGLIVENNAFADNTAFARQIGALPPEGSRAELSMARALNAKTKVARRLAAGPVEEVAPGVWLVRGGAPKKLMNVYFVKDGDGVAMFDAGIAQMTNELMAAAAALGGLTRVILGHSHADHRGAAAGAHVDVFCHEAERADAEADGGAHYFHMDELNAFGRVAFGRMLPVWDGGPVPIAGTLKEGDDVAGFEVVHLPGHAPGLIALWRASDRLALSTDCFYTINPVTTLKGRARVPHAAFNQDTEQARESIRKLAALRPAAAWPGHADPVTGDVAGELERAADWA